jgi:hypothetical protein
MAKITTKIQTIIADPTNSSLVGHVTFLSSPRTSDKKVIILFIAQISASFVALWHLAGQEGFEPPTRGFGVRRSTN